MRDLHPFLNTEDILGGVWIPQDACVDAGKVSEVFAHLAAQGGAKFVSSCGVKKVLTSNDRPVVHQLSTIHQSNRNLKVTGVETEKWVHIRLLYSVSMPIVKNSRY